LKIFDHQAYNDTKNLVATSLATKNFQLSQAECQKIWLPSFGDQNFLVATQLEMKYFQSPQVW